MNWKTCKFLIISDLKRVVGGGGKVSVLSFLFNYYVSDSFKVSLWLRLGTYFMNNPSKLYRPLCLFSKIYYKHVEHKTGIQVPFGTQIGEGLKFYHHDCIIIAQSAKIGKNASIHQGVTIGRVFAGPNAGVPTIGDSVVIFAGAKILGNIHIGDGAVIGANAVVIKDVPANAVVAGIPARIISDDSNRCFEKGWGGEFVHDYYE